ncbi:MAG TPA: sulfatase-like hydrolase/transferase [Pyrinomonadaceae bacterium]|nr:sulfatase-like hydrolase/transferase [Pyrinomonadaceae bacterium]
MTRKILIALSLASLCFLPAWRDILDPATNKNIYYARSDPRWIELLAVTCNILLVSALLFPVVSVALRAGRGLAATAARVALLGVALFTLNALRVQFDLLYFPNLAAKLGRAGAVLLVLALLAAIAFAALRLGLARLTAGVAAAYLILSPFTLVAYAQAIMMSARYVGKLTPAASAAPARRAGAERGARVLWLLFDEMEYRLLFDERPPTLKAPEFDRLLAASLHASHAYPPASYTELSLPALTTGRLVAKAWPEGPSELLIQYDGSNEKVGWTTQPTIFGRITGAGRTVALSGWYHPYCRLFGASLTKCFDGNPVDQSVTDKMFRQAEVSLLTLPRLYRMMPEELRAARLAKGLRAYGTLYSDLMGAAKAYATDPELDLVFVHLQVPHPPNFYDRSQGRFAFERKNSYLDSLALADRALGELRGEMEAAGLWDSTAVLISSDHWWRGKELHDPAGKKPDFNPFWSEEDKALLPEVVDERVPFILKLAGQRQGAAYEQPFNTVLTHDLLLALLRGEIADPAAAAAWLDAHKTIAKSPYYQLEAGGLHLPQ